MKLSDVKKALQNLELVQFELPNGKLVPSHFHVTEVGKITKHFIDCGGVTREEEVINFQLWTAEDYDHRLFPDKLSKIIEQSERILNLNDSEIEVEYQSETIGKYGLDFNGINFVLALKQTDCLAKDNCGIPVEKTQRSLADLNSANSCSPGSGCC